MSTIIVGLTFLRLFGTYVTIFKRKNVFQIYDNFSTSPKIILHLKPCIM